MLGQRRRRWPSIEPALAQCVLFAGIVTLSSLSPEIFVLYRLIIRSNHCYWEINVSLGIKCSISNMSYFHPLEVVGRGSETQLRVGENLNRITQREKGQCIYSRNHINT